MSTRTVDGKVLTLAPTGWTYTNRFVIYDYETESLWFCLDGECNLTCVGGAYTGKELSALPSTIIKWNEWIARHPNTRFMVLSKEEDIPWSKPSPDPVIK